MRGVKIFSDDEKNSVILGSSEVASAPDTKTEFCNALRNIDFGKSRMDPEQLQKKEDPTQPWGDLQYTAFWLAYMIGNDGRDYSYIPHIDEMDQQLLHIIRKYDDAIAIGRVIGSWEARNALLVGFNEIRMALPTLFSGNRQQPELETYMCQCVEYLKQYAELIDFATFVDVALENVNRAENMYLELYHEVQELQSQLEWELSEDLTVIEDFIQLTVTLSTDVLSPQQNILRLRLVDIGVKRTVCALWKTVWEQRKLQLGQMEGELNLLRAKMTTSLPELDYSARIADAIQNMTQNLIKEDEKLRQGGEQWRKTEGEFSRLAQSLEGHKRLDEKARRTAVQISQKSKEVND